MKIFFCYFFLLILSLTYGLGLKQKNSEELFLSDTAHEKMQKLHKLFPMEAPTFVANIPSGKIAELELLIENLGGEFSSLHPKKIQEGMVLAPSGEDEDRFNFFKTLKRSFPSLQFAGETYLNAELAGMALRIQEKLFPILFMVMAFLCLICLRNIKSVAYVFFTSLLGAGVGLSLVRLIYGTSTILTTLTPMVGFILTLGVQLHVVYGVHFLGWDKFVDEKKRPLMMMMFTTILGFYSLLSSDLEVIRQFSLTAGTTLMVTWGINLMIFWQFKPLFKIRHYHFKNYLRHLTPKPWIGYGILTFLSLSGIMAVFKMPILVEATYFFPKNHPVREGIEYITKLQGGTPQFEILWKKKDHSEWSQDDYRQIVEIERSLPGKVISTGILIEEINLEYSGEKKIPDHSTSFELLFSKIPPLLSRQLRSQNFSKTIILMPPLKHEKRLSIEKNILQKLKNVPSLFEAELTGLNFHLLHSQANLINSLLKGFGISLFTIVALFVFFERNPFAILNFTFVNVASLLGGIALLAIGGLELNISSVMTVSISMGLVVDSTIHLMFMHDDKNSAFATYHPIIISHVLLFGSFLILVSESFLPIRDFSLGLITLLFIGLLCDLFVLPLIQKNEKL